MKRYKLLREELRDRGVRQDAVAREIGLPRSAVSQRMTGRTPWTVREAYAVLKLLNYGPQMLPVLFPEYEVRK